MIQLIHIVFCAQLFFFNTLNHTLVIESVRNFMSHYGTNRSVVDGPGNYHRFLIKILEISKPVTLKNCC